MQVASVACPSAWTEQATRRTCFRRVLLILWRRGFLRSSQRRTQILTGIILLLIQNELTAATISIFALIINFQIRTASSAGSATKTSQASHRHRSKTHWTAEPFRTEPKTTPFGAWLSAKVTYSLRI